MIRGISLAMITVAAWIAQASVRLPPPADGWRLPALTAAVVYAALAHGRTWALATAVVAGCLHDALSNIPLGTTSACLALAALALGRFRKLSAAGHAPLLALLGAAVSGLVTVATGAWLCARGALSWEHAGVLRAGLASAMLGALTAPLVGWAGSALDSAVGNARRAEPEDSLA